MLKGQKGFTIIEVVLVLAIAGLIFLMVFIALPALQRGQRDTQRRNDLARAQTGVQNYQTNNRNDLPAANNAAWNGMANSYLRSNGDKFADPSRGDYQFQQLDVTGTPTYNDATPTVYYTIGAVCSGESATTSGGGTKKVALRMKLEGGGIACVNN